MLECNGISIGYFTPEVEALLHSAIISYKEGILKPAYENYLKDKGESVELALKPLEDNVALRLGPGSTIDWFQSFPDSIFLITIKKPKQEEA